MKISRETVEYVAGLARLDLKEDEKDKLTIQMGEILSYVEKLNELDTSGVQPLEHVESVNNVFRKDVAGPSMDRKKILENAPEAEEGAFSVPEIIE